MTEIADTQRRPRAQPRADVAHAHEPERPPRRLPRLPRILGRPGPRAPGDGMVSTAAVDLADVQGNILRGYRTQRVRHLVLRVADVAIARVAGSARRRATIAALAPAITPAAPWARQARHVLQPRASRSTGSGRSGCRRRRSTSFPAPVRRRGWRPATSSSVTSASPRPTRGSSRSRDAERVHVIASIYADALAVARRRPARRARADTAPARSSWSVPSTGRCSTATPSTSAIATTSPSRGSTGSTIPSLVP